MNVYCVCNKEGSFIGFIKAEDKETAKQKLKSLPFSCKVYKDGFSLNRKWTGKNRCLNYKKEDKDGTKL